MLAFNDINLQWEIVIPCVVYQALKGDPPRGREEAPSGRIRVGHQVMASHYVLDG